jgi:hypothetical protein
MNAKRRSTESDNSGGKAKALLVAVVMTAAMLGAGGADADEAKPKQQPATGGSISLTYQKIETEYKDQAPGPSVGLQGVLHLVSNALLSQYGTPAGFTLHGNLAGASAVSADGSQSYVAVGADGIPAECDPSEPCVPPFWTLMFRLVPTGSGHAANLYFNLTVIPQYGADGALVSACVVGQDGCEPPDQLE